jgi:hypothetical protein
MKEQLLIISVNILIILLCLSLAGSVIGWLMDGINDTIKKIKTTKSK